jgi:predicted MFS family arabinose efflux permease
MFILAALIQLDIAVSFTLIIGLLVFGATFAINSSLHSYLIVNLAKSDAVSLDVGFYYMANATGRLVGTVFSGLVYKLYGLQACLWVSVSLLFVVVLVTQRLNKQS